MLKQKYDFNDFVNIIELLRSKEGCPWDREQTHDSIKQNLIEETYEVLEAIDLKDKNKMIEELGDMLLQIVFHAQIAKEAHNFDINDIISGICLKLINRHPHVFGQEKIEKSDEVLKNWEINKKIEKGMKNQTDVLKSVPSNLPALIRSLKIQEKAAQVGFDWDNIEDVFNKILEEIGELKEVYKSKNIERITDELGDVFFSIVNLSRTLHIHPELALTSTIKKFIYRFEYMEVETIKEGKTLNDLNLSEMDKLWEKAKNNY